MGSFDGTCAISGLPLSAGTPVRFLLLTENPYNDSLKCHSTSVWAPRTLPLKGFYNDYGGVEGYPEGAHLSVWMEALRYDMVEKGMGDNTCHDVPVTKDMTFEQMLEAVWEGRLTTSRFGRTPTLRDALFERAMKAMDKADEILAKYGERSSRSVPREPETPYVSPVGEPSFRRIALDLASAGFAEGMFVVDDENYRSVRVRATAYGDKGTEDLKRAEAALKEHYAVMLTSGGGHYAGQAELLVRPLPGSKVAHSIKPDSKEPLRVALAMIREDVWQALVKIGKTVNSDLRFDKVVEHDIAAAVAREWTQNRWALHDEHGAVSYELAHGFGVDSGGRFVPKNHALSTVGCGSHWDLMVMRDNVPKDEVAEFLATCAEFTYVDRVLDVTRYQWRPSYPNGPQFGEYAAHARVLTAFADIAGGVAKKNDEELDD